MDFFRRYADSSSTMFLVKSFCLQKNEHTPGWKTEKTWTIPGLSPRLAQTFSELIQANPADAWFFWDLQLGDPSLQLVESCLDEPFDLWHAGLRLGTGGKPGLIDFAAPTWMFNRDPDPSIEATSWRVSLQACLVRSEVIQQMGFLRPEFQTLEAAALEWGHRCLQYGALLRHQPGLLPAGSPPQAVPTLPLEDELRFMYYRYGQKWAAWAAVRAGLSGYASLWRSLQAWRKVAGVAPPPQPGAYRPALPAAAPEPADPSSKSPTQRRVSVLLPTLQRYSYLHSVLTQLGGQSLPPHEILVVDQTPVSERQPELYRQFSHLPLRVFYQDQAGQCSSRNLGLAQASGEFVLFLDDDVDIHQDLIVRHLANLEQRQIHASCGVADETGAGPLPEAFTRRRASDVFPAGNTLLRKTALHQSGLFDLAYEHGARADGDLGMRLFLSGACLVLDPQIRILHHHAPRGGLRTYKARSITYASSRKSLLQRNLPGVTELYLSQRYFTPRQVREKLWLSALGTFNVQGTKPRRLLKALLGCLLLPHTLWLLHRRMRAAQQLLLSYPQIPQLSQETIDQ